MKALFLIILSTIAQCSFAANDIKDFTGRFITNELLCPGFSSPERVYIQIKSDSDGISSLFFQFYGDEARAYEILLGKGSRQAPGTDRDIHGEVTESWSTVFLSDNVLEETVRTVRPSIDLDLTQVSTLTLQGNQLTLTYPSPSDGYEACTMVRVK